MASISTGKDGLRRIKFSDASGKPRAIYLGRTPKKAAEGIKTRVEALMAASISGVSIDNKTAEWLASRDGAFYSKLFAVGLVPERAKPSATLLGQFIDGYIDSRSDVKLNTREHLKRARNNLVNYFGTTRDLSTIKPGDADDFRQHLKQTLGDNTVRRICGRAKQFFRAAARKGLVAKSRFEDMKDTGVRADKTRLVFVSRDVSAKVLDACPDAQWRLLFALNRFGGLRCPSESLALREGDIDWEHDRFTVHSPKTEHHEGHESRLVPIFPELRPYLEAAFDAAAEGTEYVITRYRERNCNLRTQLERIIRKAGVEPCGKPFQNLRSTRETELAESFPMHVVCAWIGNSESIAKKHYLQVTEAHLAEASKVTQIPTHQAVPGRATERHGARRNSRKREENAISAGFAIPEAPPQGLEPWTSGLTVRCSTN